MCATALRFGLLLVPAVLAFALVAGANDADDEAQADWLRLKGEAESHAVAGRVRELVDAARELVATAPELFGEDHEAVAVAHILLARGQQELGAFAAARESLEAARDLTLGRYGEDDWRVVDRRLAIANLAIQERLAEEDRIDLDAASGDRRRALQAFREGRVEDAVRLLASVHRTCARILGERHSDTLTQLSDLGSVHARAGRWDEAAPAWRQVLEARLEILGEVHPDTAKSLNDVALLAASIGEPEEAERLWRRALRVRETVLGPAHPDTTLMLTNLGELCLEQRRFEEAEHLFLEARGRLLDSSQAGTPDAVNLLSALGRLYARVGNHERAAGFFRLEVEARRKRGETATPTATPTFGVALNNLAHELAELGEFAAAEVCLDEALEVLKATLGPKHPRTATATAKLGLVLHQQGRRRRAVELCREAVQAKQAALGDDHPETASTLAILGLVLQGAGASAEAEPVLSEALRIRRAHFGEEHPDTAESLVQWGTFLLDSARYAEAEPALRHALDVHRKVHGPTHPATVLCLHNLGSLYVVMGHRDRALAHLRPAVAILRESWGSDHPYLARALHDLAAVFRRAGEYDQALALYQEALSIRERARGTDHPEVVTTLRGLAAAHAEAGRHAEAEALARRALDGCRRVYGDDHRATAGALRDLGRVHSLAGRYWDALPLLQEARETYDRVSASEELAAASVLTDLGALNVLMGDLDMAVHHIGRALEITLRTRGPAHPATAEVLDLLGLLFTDLDEHEKAASYLLRAHEIRRRVFGPGHPKAILSIKNLAGLRFQMGRFPEAAELYEQALALHRARGAPASPFEGLLCVTTGMARGFGGEVGPGERRLREGIDILDATTDEANPIRIRALLALSHNLVGQGRRAEALPLLETGLALARRHLDASFTVRSERQQLAMTELFRPALGAFLGLTGRDATAAARAHDVVLAWKGAALSRQLAARAAAVTPEARGLLDELSAVSARLAARSLSEPMPDNPRERARVLGPLMLRREEIETELAAASREFEEARSLARVTSAEVSRRLPEDVCLLDFVTYWTSSDPAHALKPEAWEEHLAVFVVRGGTETRRVDLGPAAAVATAATAWREALSRTPNADPRAEGEALARLVWHPVARDVADASVVLVSPDGPVSRIPFGALPGETPGSYLLEERAFAVLPVPQLLPRLLPRGATADGRGRDTAALLLVGDVDYDAVGGAFAERPPFARLPGTRREIDTVEGTYRAAFPDAGLQVLRGTEATEAAVRTIAPRSSYVHLATHGFFAPPRRHRVGAGIRGGFGTLWGRPELHLLPPMLLSGIALCGANRVPATGVDDGIWTALEVSALDLSAVDLAVLSACETGLGEVAGGEGVLGLQRAWQIAGARTTITSLWSVPDEATAELMRRFYENLWQGKQSRLEALRHAQLVLLREGGGEGGSIRGPVRTEPRSRPALPERLPPFFWGAFVLSGDWR